MRARHRSSGRGRRGHGRGGRDRVRDVLTSCRRVIKPRMEAALVDVGDVFHNKAQLLLS